MRAERTNVYPEIWSSARANQFLPEGTFVKEFIKTTILIFGYATGFNSKERNKELADRLKQMKLGLTLTHYDGLKKVIKSRNKGIKAS